MGRTGKIVAVIFAVCSIIVPSPASAFLEGLPIFFDDGTGKNNNNDDIVIGNLHIRNPFRGLPPPPKLPLPFDTSNGEDSGSIREEGNVEGKRKPTKNKIGVRRGGRGLRVGFYDGKCPRAEEIVKEVVGTAYRNDSTVAAALIRILFHDCFVNGCDASLLLDKTPSNEPVEKLAPENLQIVGTEVIDQIKAQLEIECPGTVSCSDVISFAARDSLVLSGIPTYDVAAGRRDGRSSRQAAIKGNLPHPDSPLNNIVSIFAKKGLTAKEMVTLTGAHSIGVAHCSNFAYRVARPDADKVIERTLVNDIRFFCRSDNITLPFDSTTEYAMDAQFYGQLLRRQALLESDQKMADNPKLRLYMQNFASDQGTWFKKFTDAIVKMGTIGVLTGDQGEIRNQCRLVN